MAMKKILVITNEDDPHADKVIQKLGDCVFRFNTEMILNDFNIGISILSHSNKEISIKGYDRKIAFEEIGSVYYRRPIKPVVEESELSEIREGEAWGALYHFLYGLDNLPWMGHPLRDKRNSSRMLQLNTAVDVGFQIPNTLISRDSKEIRRFVKKCGLVAVKPIHMRGLTQDDKWIPYFTEVISYDRFNELDEDVLTSTYNYIQKYIPKKREWRVTIVGDSIFPCVLESQNAVGGEEDWRKIKYSSIKHYFEELPDAITEMILKYCRKLKLPFGAMDLIETPEGDWYFLECNPNGQWLWIEELTNQPISTAIAAWHKAHL